MNEGLKTIRRKHFADALHAAYQIEKKGGRIIQQLLLSCRLNGTTQGLDENRFYVREAFVGGGVRSRMIAMKARGRAHWLRRPFTHVTIIMEELPLDQMVKRMLRGETPPAFGELFRRKLFTSNADFEDVRKFSRFLTSRGRHY